MLARCLTQEAHQRGVGTDPGGSLRLPEPNT